MNNGVVRIVVCDDEREMLTKVAVTLTAYIEDRELRAEVNTYTDPARMLKEKGVEMDILILDIEMPKLDGFTVAEKLREMGYMGKIIMLTVHDMYAKKAYRLDIFRFLYKREYTYEDFEEAMDTAIRRLSADTMLLKCLETKERHQVRLQDVLYIESLGEGTSITSRYGSYTSAKALKVWEKELKGEFFRCHKASLVNMAYVAGYSDDWVYMKNKHKVKLSVRKRGQIRAAMNAYITRKVRFER